MKKLFIIFVLALFVSSCAKKEDFSFEGVDNINIESFSMAGSASIAGDVSITNNSRQRLTIDNLDLQISSSSRQIAYAVLEEAIVVPARSSEPQRATINIRLSPGTSAMALMSLANNINNLYVGGTIDIKLGALSRTVDIPKTRVGGLIESLDL